MGEGPLVAAPPRRRPGGALLWLPDTRLWRAPVNLTPVPTPTPDYSQLAVLPGVPRLEFARDRDFVEMVAEPFRFRGRPMERDPPGHAHLSLATPYTALRAELRLEPLEGDARGEGLRTVHGPGTAERFSVPAGIYRFERLLWRPEDPQAVRREVYPAQRLSDGGEYDFAPDKAEEPDLVRDLRRRR